MTTESVDGARDDLEFIRAVVGDKGPLGAPFGLHLLLPGLIFGANFLLTWAIATGQAPWPESLADFTWAPGAVIYLLAFFILSHRTRGTTSGPSGRGFAAAWGMVGVVTAATVLVLAIATYRTGQMFAEIWPSLAFVIYGGAWTVAALIRRKAWLALVALGSFATAAIAASQIGTAAVWLVDAVGIVLFMALPGGAIVYLARRMNRRM
jgi:hypothetical protein